MIPPSLPVLLGTETCMMIHTHIPLVDILGLLPQDYKNRNGNG